MLTQGCTLSHEPRELLFTAAIRHGAPSCMTAISHLHGSPASTQGCIKAPQKPSLCDQSGGKLSQFSSVYFRIHKILEFLLFLDLFAFG